MKTLDRIFVVIGAVLEEILLPLLLFWRVLRGKLTLQIWWYLLDTWWPLKFYRRRKAFYRVRKARRYKGNDEFHPSLSMDILAMVEMTEQECSEYSKDLVRRREAAHYRSL